VETILTQCPSCSKLYNIAGRDIVNESPQFKCLQCERQFWFGFDKKEFSNFGANAISVKSMLIEPFEANRNQDCPKCGAQNLSTKSECGRCGVIFAKVHGAIALTQNEKPLASTPELHELWKNIMSDFEDLRLHELFVNLCRSKGTLPFASMNYGKILSVNPNDEIAKIMRNKVITLASPSPIANVQKYIPSTQKIIWVGALAASLSIIVLGLFFRDLSNLAGFGALCLAVLLMTRAFFIRHG